MATTASAPKGDLKAWREYFQWVEKKGKQGKFRGDLQRLKNLDAPICSIKLFSNISSTKDAKKEWEKRHPWSNYWIGNISH